MQITTSHSLWLAPLCAALGTACAWWLYRRSAGREAFAPRLALLMAVLRALAIASVAFLLLEPMVSAWVREVRKPIIAVLHDGSSSVAAGADSASVKGGYAAGLKAFAEALAGDFDVRSFTYGDHFREGIDAGQHDGATDVSQAFREVADRFGGPDLGAVVVDGDGLANRGRDPRLDAARLGVPVHPILLGDTTAHPDIALTGADYNRICYLGNLFPLVVRIEARHLQGRRTRVAVTHEGREVAAQEVDLAADRTVRELAFSIKADKAGVQRYAVEARSVDGERTVANNRLDAFVEVLDARQRILLLGHAPHPDLGALRNALSGYDGYEAELAYADAFAGGLEGYDLVVLHQLPSQRFPLKELLQRARAKQVPMLFVVGAATDAQALAGLGAPVRISGQRPATIDAQAAVDAGFPSFNLEPDLVRAIESFPPLQLPFGQYDLARSAVALAKQRVGVVRTEAPLLALAQQDGRMAVLCGEGFWRWRLADQQRNGSQEISGRLVHKLVQYLAAKGDRKRFRVEHPALVNANEALVMTAEVYNQAYEQVADLPVEVVLRDEAGRDYPHAFNAMGAGYRMDAGRLAPGRYTWTARAALPGEPLSAKGEFTVRPLLLEQLSTVADHGLWRDIAARTGGTVHEPGDWEALAEQLKASGTLAARSFAQQRYTDLVALRWPFFILLLLLAAEWMLRRRSGAY
jgi:hypothetical protein